MMLMFKVEWITNLPYLFLNKHVAQTPFFPDCESNAVINALENELASEGPQPQAHHIRWQPSFQGHHLFQKATFTVPRAAKPLKLFCKLNWYCTIIWYCTIQLNWYCTIWYCTILFNNWYCTFLFNQHIRNLHNTC